MDRECGARLMLIGSEDDDTAFINMVESVGATVVADDHCTGSRYFWNSTEFTDQILPDIANRYIDRPACPTKDWEERTRFPHVLEMARDFKVDGALLIQQKFCDPHECDMVPLKEFLNGHDIPTLSLEFDVTVPLGPMRIRVEAFLERPDQKARPANPNRMGAWKKCRLMNWRMCSRKRPSRLCLWEHSSTMAGTCRFVSTASSPMPCASVSLGARAARCCPPFSTAPAVGTPGTNGRSYFPRHRSRR